MTIRVLYCHLPKLNKRKEFFMSEVNINDVISQALANGETNCPEGVNPAQWEMAKAVYFNQIGMSAQAASVAAPQAAPVASVPVASVPATLGNATAPAAYTPQSSAFDLDAPTSSGLSGVEGYLKCKHSQTIVDDKIVTNNSFIAEIVMANVTKKLSIRGGSAGNIKYFSTTDGVTANDGTPWMTAIQNIQRIQADARPYTSYDIPLKLCEDLVNVSVVNGQAATSVVAPAGTVLGHTTAITGRAGFESLINDLKRDGKVPSNEIVYVRVVRQDRNKGSFAWATFNFELLDENEAATYAAKMSA